MVGGISAPEAAWQGVRIASGWHNQPPGRISTVWGHFHGIQAGPWYTGGAGDPLAPFFTNSPLVKSFTRNPLVKSITRTGEMLTYRPDISARYIRLDISPCYITAPPI